MAWRSMRLYEIMRKRSTKTCSQRVSVPIIFESIGFKGHALYEIVAESRSSTPKALAVTVLDDLQAPQAGSHHARRLLEAILPVRCFTRLLSNA